MDKSAGIAGNGVCFGGDGSAGTLGILFGTSVVGIEFESSPAGGHDRDVPDLW